MSLYTPQAAAFLAPRLSPSAARLRSSLTFASASRGENNTIMRGLLLFGARRGFSTQQGVQRAATAAAATAPAAAAAAAPTAAAAAGAPQYRRVPFVREDISVVMQEVPDFKYYYIGEEKPSKNPYKDIPMHTPIFKPVSFIL